MDDGFPGGDQEYQDRPDSVLQAVHSFCEALADSSIFAPSIDKSPMIMGWKMWDCEP